VARISLPAVSTLPPDKNREEPVGEEIRGRTESGHGLKDHHLALYHVLSPKRETGTGKSYRGGVPNQ